MCMILWPMTSDDQKERLREEVRVSLEIVENLTGVECPLNMISMLVLKLKLAQSRREWHQAYIYFVSPRGNMARRI